jgi:hypothetical protein
MNRKTIHGIDPYAPGGIDALLAHHRLTFGDAVMEAGAGEGGAGDPAPAADPAPAPDPAPTADPAPEPQAAEWDGKVESLPAAAQKVIADLRKEAGDERVAAKTLAAIQSALNPDAKAGEKPTAEALTKALTERDADAKQAKTELAVFRLAAKQGADADALLDSRAFLAKIAELDPTKTADIEKAITAAVKDNPKLKTVQAAGASGANFTGGSGEGASKPTTIAGSVAAHYGA